MQENVCLIEYEEYKEYKEYKELDLKGMSLRQKTDKEIVCRKEKIEELSKKSLEFYELAEKYKWENAPEIKEVLQKCEVTENILYGTDSSIPAGYFCSDPIYDLVVGKTKRGKLSRSKPSKGYYHTYYFDNERLIKEQTPDSGFTLYFYNDSENTVYEALFYGEELHNITECVYDDKNRIIKRTVFLSHIAHKMFFMFHVGDEKPMVIRDKNKGIDLIFEITEKKYNFESDRLLSVQVSEYHSVNPIVRYERYDFSFDGDYYSEYKIFDYFPERYNSSVFKPLRKRRYDEFISPPRYSECK